VPMTTNGTGTSRRRGRPGYDVASLLDVTVQVFIDRGFDGTTMQNLSQRLGISKSAIYHHVSSKDELLALALDRALDGMDSVVEGTRQLDASSISRREHLVRGSVRVLIAQKPFVTLLLRVRGNTEVERNALKRRREFDRFAAELVRAAVGEGSVQQGVHPELTARLLFGMINSLVEWVHPATPEEVNGLIDSVWSMAFAGIGVQPPPDLAGTAANVVVARESDL
jgi:AcrR family transcriptional regulator